MSQNFLANSFQQYLVGIFNNGDFVGIGFVLGDN